MELMNLGSFWYQMGGRFLLFVFLKSFFLSVQEKKDALFDITISMMAKKASLSSLWIKRAKWIDKRNLKCSLSLNFL